jgi:hypothetical protein
MPASIAAGVATRSSSWSSHGTEYAPTSSSVAVPSAASAGVLASHENSGDSDSTPVFAAIPAARSGTKTRKPAAAARPSPTAIPNRASAVTGKKSID